ncbi:MAG: glycerol-3-phosphate responsive antiterminator [Armatimonadota bacterium]|nr:glycerol-3-phosphate responsive antiterminator [Armatimonadota bacterium]MDR7465220.1 glycerol-3-phosphate responsive antiterminator [Armatimonadota bacterium]MDR7469293.1 glycerol-3-phosphate responsive antiterminator [Armatimonadota bacterium]MDR7475636.1 glycerol-3-phosphate responsive antiterminator [Armatimonadota bacterium]MDR7539207.1 glycerol-3-phosphate responsive antiterminator [Armatimonadota bacterium]
MTSPQDPWSPLRTRPIIAAIRTDAVVPAAMAAPVATAFLLTGSVVSLPGLVGRLVQSGKQVLVHLDLTEGLSADRAAVQFVRSIPGIAGIITTRGHLIHAARQEGLLAVLRVFMLDSASLDTAAKMMRSCAPDAVEILPGLIYPALSAQIRTWNIPVIAGGFIRTREEVQAVLRAGALAISTSTRNLWALDLTAGKAAPG